LLIDKKFQEVHPLLNQAGHLVDGWQGSQFQKEYLKVFFLVLQVMLLFHFDLHGGYTVNEWLNLSEFASANYLFSSVITCETKTFQLATLAILT